VSLCAFLSAQTEQALTDTPPKHLLRLTYEDLLLDPVEQLTALGEFLGFADPPGWAAGVAHRVRAPAPTRSPVPA
jgi:putative sulfotransferase